MLDYLWQRVVPISAGLVALALVVWATWFPSEPEADYTFVNSSEIKSVDPAIVSGQPEGAVISELYETLVTWHPQTLDAEPGVAERWEVTPDGRTITFHLRKESYWTRLFGPEGRPERQRPVTAHDFVYSFRRFLDPLTGAEYASLLFHVVGGKEYATGEFAVGDAVEVELAERAAESLPHARGRVVYGTLVAREELPRDPAQPNGPQATLYTVETPAGRQRFVPGSVPPAVENAQACVQVLRDFRTVAIRALDDWTLQIELKWYVPYFVKICGFYCLSPVQRECLETHGYPAWTEPRNIVTNGPFLLESRRIRDRIRLVKNPHYWDADQVHLEIVDALAVQSSTTGLNLYMTGAVDYIRTVPAAIAPELIAQQRTDFNPSPFLASYYYEINVTQPPLDNPKFRRALDLAIDKHKLIGEVTRAREVATGRLVPTQIPDYDLYKSLHQIADYPGPNIPLARQLIAEIYPPGTPIPKFRLLYNTDDTHAVIAQYFQAQWKENLGIDCELVNKEWASYLADRRAKKYDIARAGWIGDYVDPMTFLDLYESDNPQNRAGFKDPEYDALLRATYAVELDDAERAAVIAATKAAPGYNPAVHDRLWEEQPDLPQRLKRMELFARAEQRLIDSQALLPIYVYVAKEMCRDWVSGVYPNIQNVHPLKGVKVDKEARRRFRLGEGRR